MSVDTLTANGGPISLTPPAIAGDGTFTPDDFAAMGGSPDEFVIVYQSSSAIAATTYTMNGSVVATQELENHVGFVEPASAATITQGGVALGYENASAPGPQAIQNAYLTVIESNGQPLGAAYQFTPTDHSQRPALTTTNGGVHANWIAVYDQNGQLYQPSYMQDFAATGAPTDSPTAYWAYADTTLGGVAFQVFNNQVQLMNGSAPVTLPGEPAQHAVFDPVTAGLSSGMAVVAWEDSGTAYMSMYDSATNTLSARTELDWGIGPGSTDFHLVTLADGGFALSWENQGQYKGELFDGSGNGGGIMTLSGQFGGIDSHGDLYTVGFSGSGLELLQTYTVNSGGASSGGTGGAGQTYTSDNNGDTWIGTSGDDTFHLGRGGDTVTGNGGNDTYTFAEIPWAGGHITDFNAGDTLDLTGLMGTTQDTGTDGFADGYLKITNDSAGNAEIWARYGNVDNAADGSGNWWLVETLNGLSASALATNGDVVTVSPGGGGVVSTSASNYVAAPNVVSIALTGSHQHIDASATSGVTINSNNTGNTLIGGGGNDLFHLGRGGDIVTGGTGADTFAYAETPWAGGTITDFNASEGDAVDVSGLLARSGYAGSDPFADQYLKYTTDSNGNAQLWSDVHQSGNTGWWLVATLDGVSSSSLHYSAGLIT